MKSFVTPSTRKNMLLAGLLGVFLGVLLAFLADYSSNKISSVEQIDGDSRNGSKPSTSNGTSKLSKLRDRVGQLLRPGGH